MLDERGELRADRAFLYYLLMLVSQGTFFLPFAVFLPLFAVIDLVAVLASGHSFSVFANVLWPKLLGLMVVASVCYAIVSLLCVIWFSARLDRLAFANDLKGVTFEQWRSRGFAEKFVSRHLKPLWKRDAGVR